MNTSTTRSAWSLILLLVLLMAATRSHHFAGLHSLPDASWAAFFLAGFYLKQIRSFVILTVLAVAIDWTAITVGGVADFCVTPAYALLLPAHAALWLGGRWYAQRHHDRWTTLLPLAAAVAVSALVAELLSSGGFYFLGGRFAEPTLAEFLPRLVKYFPSMLGSMALYVALAALLHALVTISITRHTTHQS